MDIGYTFANTELEKLALLHSSAGMGRSNERLEFLGDAVLELISSERIYKNLPDAPEGVLTRRRAALVREESLAAWARSVGLGGRLVLGKGEEATGGREKDSILADAAEAVFGAAYLDGGLAAAQSVVCRALEYIENHAEMLDAKTQLQELLQRDGEIDLKYETYHREGPPHAPVFYVRAMLDGEPIGEGSGGSRKGAEQQAARNALRRLALEKGE